MIEILGERGGVYFPIVQLDVEHLRETGFGNQFMLRYNGQMCQLVPPPDFGSTPQESSPVQDLNSDTGGNPDRTTREAVENVTVFFATGQSNLVSGMG